MILVDTTIWSLALRRRSEDLNPHEQELAKELARLLTLYQAAWIGPIRQELLSGIRSPQDLWTIQTQLDECPALQVTMADYDGAAGHYNTCRANGIASGGTDMLICSVASRTQSPIFTTDPDFQRYSACLPIQLYRLASPHR